MKPEVKPQATSFTSLCTTYLLTLQRVVPTPILIQKSHEEGGRGGVTWGGWGVGSGEHDDEVNDMTCALHVTFFTCKKHT